MKKAEILGLTWDDIDFQKNVISITKSVCYTDNQVIIKEPKSKTSIRKITLPTVSKRLGHAQKSTTLNIYAHSIERMDEKASDVMESLFYDEKEAKKYSV